MAAAGHQAEHNLHETVNNHPFILVVEGGIPTKDNGIHCMISGRPAMEILAEVAPKASAIIAIGSCANFGGIQAASPNPTGAVGVWDLVKDKTVVNISGCPPNPVSFLGTILHYMTFNRLPKLDKLNRPMFAYGRRIHDHCERRAHFDEGRFVEQFGDEFHQLGYCLYKVGCKGPETFANCPAVRFNDVAVWPVSASRLDELILELRASFGTTVVVVSHDLDSIFRIADRALFLDIEQKTMTALGSPADLRDHPPNDAVHRFLTRSSKGLP
jgi:hydrogenase small subunit/[NiFe] hydrogenase small subunit